MEWRKLKDLIILILLVVNGFLLVLVWSRRAEAEEYEREALDQTIQVLERSGIQVEAEALSPGITPAAVERDLEREARLARALLGEEVQGDDRGGGLYLYRGTDGEVSIRAGGELSASFGSEGRRAADRPEHQAAALLEELGLEVEPLGTRTQGGETVVRFRQIWNGAAVFSCEVSLTYREGYLTALEGCLLLGAAGAAEAGQALDLPTALMRFSEEVAATGDVCTAVQSMEAGYRGTVQSLSGGVRLWPVWLVTTDTAKYYLDCLTGGLTRLTDQ